MRGEYMCGAINELTFQGSPPHARGIHFLPKNTLKFDGITPACAGNTLFDSSVGRLLRDHPRMRGEYPTKSLCVLSCLGSPPHARGIRATNMTKNPLLGITPACAGNTCSNPVNQSSRRDHPRMRGEYDALVASEIVEKGSPPHARGIPDTKTQKWQQAGITPACAGNTCKFA